MTDLDTQHEHLALIRRYLDAARDHAESAYGAGDFPDFREGNLLAAVVECLSSAECAMDALEGRVNMGRAA